MRVGLGVGASLPADGRIEAAQAATALCEVSPYLLAVPPPSLASCPSKLVPWHLLMMGHPP